MANFQTIVVGKYKLRSLERCLEQRQLFSHRCLGNDRLRAVWVVAYSILLAQTLDKLGEWLGISSRQKRTAMIAALVILHQMGELFF